MSFELIILGSSSALPTSKRSTAAHLLNINERFFLVDCGEGTQIQLRKNKLSAAKINHIFISHLHGDHVFGLFGLISSLGLMGRKAALNIYGPAALKELLQSHLNFFGEPAFEIKLHQADDQKIIFEDSKLSVLSIRLKHRSDTFGYIFKEKPLLLNLKKSKIAYYGLGIEDMKLIKEGRDYLSSDGKLVPNAELTLPPFKLRSYAYISDTAYLPAITESIRGVDLLYHEATFEEKDRKLAEQTLHSTSKDAAEIAKMAGVGRLLLGHFSTRYRNERIILQEAQSVFPETTAVNDGDRFFVEQQRLY